MRFLITSHVEHRRQDLYYTGYVPYVREMNLWLKFVDEVEIVAPLRDEKAVSQITYEHDQIKFTRIQSFNLLSFSNLFRTFITIPVIGGSLLSAMKRADHIHLRCPGNIGLLGCICQIFFPAKPKTTKYAGNWDPQSVQPWSYKLQKWILSNTFLTRNMTVLVYGDWPGQTKNIKSFFTASFSEKEILNVRTKKFAAPFLLLFVGNLVPGKHPLHAIQLVNRLKKQGCEVQLEIYGDGPERQLLETYCREEDLQDLVQLKGSRSLEELKEAYQKAHFLILASDSEGWPKAVAEAMFFGVIPISTAVSCVPWMLGEGSRGVLFSSTETRKNEGRDWIEQNTHKIAELMKDEDKMQRMSTAAKEWSQQYTLERFEREIKKLLK